jgi:uncharacterized protein
MTQQQFTAPITYFLQEGRENLEECLKIAFQGAKQHSITTIVIFTARGEGVKVAVERFQSQPEYGRIRLVAVTFPQGKQFTDSNNVPITVEISKQDRDEFRRRNIPIVQARLPFDPITPIVWQTGTLGQDLNLVGSALGMFGGSMSLCIQAVVVACDAGEIGLGEHVVALTSDTAILVQATSTRRMLSELIVREILCKPAILSIGRAERVDSVLDEPSPEPLTGTEPKTLPPPE